MSTDRSNLRASDADRRRVADALQQHYVDGRLSSEELTERVQKANVARTYGDLDVLLADLPRQPPAATTPPAAPAPPAPAGTAPAAEPAASGGPWSKTDVRTNVTSYLLVMVLLIAIWLFTTPGGYFWPIWPMLGWGIAVIAHALARRGG